jgi:hypothetical protein
VPPRSTSCAIPIPKSARWRRYRPHRSRARDPLIAALATTPDGSAAEALGLIGDVAAAEPVAR